MLFSFSIFFYTFLRFCCIRYELCASNVKVTCTYITVFNGLHSINDVFHNRHPKYAQIGPQASSKAYPPPLQECRGNRCPRDLKYRPRVERQGPSFRTRASPSARQRDGIMRSTSRGCALVFKQASMFVIIIHTRVSGRFQERKGGSTERSLRTVWISEVCYSKIKSNLDVLNEFACEFDHSQTLSEI